MVMIREEVAPGKNIVAAVCTPAEHAGRWDCNICGKFTDKREDMFSVAIPWAGGHLDMDICYSCRDTLARVLISVAEKPKVPDGLFYASGPKGKFRVHFEQEQAVFLVSQLNTHNEWDVVGSRFQLVTAKQYAIELSGGQNEHA